MFRSIHWRIAVPFMVLIAVSMGISGIYLAGFVRNSQSDNLRSTLESEARITAEASLPYFTGRGSDADALAKRLGKQIGARITIIAPDGTVTGDSDENPAIMENHAARPEVGAALSSGFGESVRFSTTLGKTMMYVAVPVVSQGKVLGIARVALPLTAVESSVNRVTLTVGSAMLITALMAVLAAWLIAWSTARPIRELVAASRRIASGELGARIRVRTKDVTAQLALAFNEMSLNLKTLVETISTERSKLEGVLAYMADGVIMTDVEGRILLANKTAGRLFGFKEEDATARPLIEVVHDHEIDEVLKLCLKTGKEQAAQFESVAERRFLRAIAIPVYNIKLSGGLILFQDLTDLRSFQTVRRELVGNISHEFKTPIAGIKAMVETLRDGAIDDRQAAMDFLARIDSEVDRLAQMVSELTELSRIETGKAELRMEAANLNELIEEAAARMSMLAEKQQVSLVTELSANLPAIHVDKDRIQKTIVNLIHNAIKFNRPGGKVTISTKSDGNRMTVSVSDTGTGISKEDLPHVFERFYKADRSRSGGGTGLGLAIAKHIIEAHGGTIRAASEEGKGSTFSFSLPLHVNS